MIEVAHWSAIAPLAFLLLFRRKAEPVYWLVALGFAVSWFADAGAVMLGGSWALTYIYPAVQLGLFAWAFGAPLAALLLLAMAAVQVGGGMLDGPEVVVTLIGSLIVLYLSAGKPLALSMIVYCGLATAFYLLLVTELWSDAYMPLWYGYQASRLTAFALFGRAAWKA